mgnify:CR=1 FL=1|jgi:hypothetical protein
MQKVESFKSLIKLYTLETIFDKFGEKLRNSRFEDIQSYLASVVQGLAAHGQQFSYTNYAKPVWRGMNYGDIKLEDYKPHSIGYWP